MQHAASMGVPDAPAHRKRDLGGPEQGKALPDRRKSIQLLLKVGPVNDLHLEPRDRPAVEQAVDVHEIGSSERLDSPDLLAYPLQQLGIEVYEDFECNVSPNIP